MENNGTINIQLSADELNELTGASEQVQVMGERYTEAQEAATGL